MRGKGSISEIEEMFFFYEIFCDILCVVPNFPIFSEVGTKRLTILGVLNAQ